MTIGGRACSVVPARSSRGIGSFHEGFMHLVFLHAEKQIASISAYSESIKCVEAFYEAIFSRGGDFDSIGGDFRHGCAEAQYRERAGFSGYSRECALCLRCLL